MSRVSKKVTDFLNRKTGTRLKTRNKVRSRVSGIAKGTAAPAAVAATGGVTALPMAASAVSSGFADEISTGKRLDTKAYTGLLRNSRLNVKLLMQHIDFT